MRTLVHRLRAGHQASLSIPQRHAEDFLKYGRKTRSAASASTQFDACGCANPLSILASSDRNDRPSLRHGAGPRRGPFWLRRPCSHRGWPPSRGPIRKRCSARNARRKGRFASSFEPRPSSRRRCPQSPRRGSDHGRPLLRPPTLAGLLTPPGDRLRQRPVHALPTRRNSSCGFLSCPL